jgi:hypothetical protein
VNQDRAQPKGQAKAYQIKVVCKCLNCNKTWTQELRFIHMPNGRLMFGLCESCRKEVLKLK